MPKLRARSPTSSSATAPICGLNATTHGGPRPLGLPAGTSRRNDTLDVWIDSGVSHRAVLQKRPELQARGIGGAEITRAEAAAAGALFPFRPADVYIEATDQHRGWFQSSLMTSVALHDGAPPYKTVITHGFVVDKDTRKKVSKSAQGTYVKPMDADHFVEQVRRGYRAALGLQRGVYQRGSVLGGKLRGTHRCLSQFPQHPPHPPRERGSRPAKLR